MTRSIMKEFEKELSKDNIYKMNNQYVITGKGESWREATDEIEMLYNAWINACELLGQGEEEIISRINKGEIYKEEAPDQVAYYFIDRKGIIGEPLITGYGEEKIDAILLLLYISSKLSDDAQVRIRDFIKKEKDK